MKTRDSAEQYSCGKIVEIGRLQSAIHLWARKIHLSKFREVPQDRAAASTNGNSYWVTEGPSLP
jgi:hypothetical protein